MEKNKTCKVIPRFTLLCSMFIMTFLFTLCFAKEANATSKGKKSDKQCALQSVTIDVGGKEYVCNGSLEYIPVEQNTDWKEFFKTIKITDYKVLVNDGCSHKERHDSITAMLKYWDDENEELRLPEFCIYEEDSTGGNHTYPDMEDELTSSMYTAFFCLDGNPDCHIRVHFAKGCPISYELNGGSFLEGMNAPDMSCVGKYTELISPVKSGNQFLGWTQKGRENEGYKNGFVWNGDDDSPTFVANWSDEAPISIASATTNLKSEYPVKIGGVTPDPVTYVDETELLCGRDYYLSFKNNDKPAAANSANPPTMILTGIGKYTGTFQQTFSITKDKVQFAYDSIGGYDSLSMVKGKTLSSIDLSDFKAYSATYDSDRVEGTFSWEHGDYKPDAEIGDCVYNDIDSGETHYNLIFTPDNLEFYEQTTFSEDICIYILQGNIADCSVTFATPQEYYYTGREIKPEVIVKDGDTTLTKGLDYKVCYAGYINGAYSTETYAPTITISGIYNYFGTKKVTYTIGKLTTGVEEYPVASDIQEGQKLSDSTLSGGKVVNSAGNTLEGHFEWMNGDMIPSVSDSNTRKYAVVFKPQNKNYEDAEALITLTIKPAPAPTATPTAVPTATPTVTPSSNPTATPSTSPTVTSSTKPAVTPSATPTATPPTKPLTKPNINPSAAPSVGTILKDKGNKTYYVVSKVAGKAVEVRYKSPVKKTKKVTIAKNVTLSSGMVATVTSIADNAFKDNKKLQEITIGNNVTTIGKNTFSGCTKLKKVVIGSGVTYIHSNAFKNCKNLKTIIITSKKLKSLSKTALKGIPSKATIKVPSSKYKAYKKLFKKMGLKKSVKIKK